MGIVTISGDDGIWFQSGCGRGCSAEVGSDDKRGGRLVKEKGIVIIEFNEFKDQEDDD